MIKVIATRAFFHAGKVIEPDSKRVLELDDALALEVLNSGRATPAPEERHRLRQDAIGRWFVMRTSGSGVK